MRDFSANFVRNSQVLKTETCCRNRLICSNLYWKKGALGHNGTRNQTKERDRQGETDLAGVWATQVQVPALYDPTGLAGESLHTELFHCYIQYLKIQRARRRYWLAFQPDSSRDFKQINAITTRLFWCTQKNVKSLIFVPVQNGNHFGNLNMVCKIEFLSSGQPYSSELHYKIKQDMDLGKETPVCKQLEILFCLTIRIRTRTCFRKENREGGHLCYAKIQ